MAEGLLRVIDAGEVGAMRSQSLWHGIASAMDADAPPVLSLCRPRRPYVGLGYHRSLEELDLAHCEELGLPVIRRRIGGGPVYVDSDQLFFQISLGAARAPARVDRLYRRFLAPAVEVFRGLGIPARLSGVNEIEVEGRRLSGTGAGRIGDGVTVVGNVLFSFPHRRMSEVLRLPSPGMRRECLRLMRRHVSSLEGEGVAGRPVSEIATALVGAYARGLGLRPRPGRLTLAERAEVERWEARFADREWLADRSSARRTGRRVKICAGVWVFADALPGLRAEVSVAGGRIVRVHTLRAPRSTARRRG